MTTRFRPALLRQQNEPIHAELHRVSGAGLPVTSRSCCRTIRALSPSIPSASRPRPARDIRTSPPNCEHAKPAAALAHPRVRPARAAIAAAARACAYANADTPRCTSAGGAAPIAQDETIVDTQYNIDANRMAPSIIAYREPLRSTSRWVISGEQPRVISDEQRRNAS